MTLGLDHLGLAPIVAKLDKQFAFLSLNQKLGKSLEPQKLFDVVGSSITGGKHKVEGMIALKNLCGIGQWAEPFLVAQLPAVLTGFQLNKKVAEECGLEIIRLISPHAVPQVLNILYKGMNDYKWQTKIGSMRFLPVLADRFPKTLADNLPDVIANFIVCLQDTKADVVQSAMQTFEEVSRKVVGNPDIQPLLPALISAYANPVTNTLPVINKLLETTFVSAVDAPTLGLLIPVLRRGMSERKVLDKRKAILILHNMCKLVVDPLDAAQFYPVIEPVIVKGVEEIVMEEVRIMCEETLATLRAVKGEALGKGEIMVKLENILEVLKAEVSKYTTEASEVVLSYVVALCYQLMKVVCVDPAEWNNCIQPYLKVFLTTEQADAARDAVWQYCQKFLAAVSGSAAGEEDVCNVEFSLAYGGKILLHNTRLWLKRSRRYGIVGQNGVGKTTLLRNINSRNLEGLPENLKTVYVQHDLDDSQSKTTVMEFLQETAKHTGSSDAEVLKLLGDVGFAESHHKTAIEALSGGWRMRLALARAVMLNADMLLMDEPTNHLDEGAVNWLISYLKSLKSTCLIVSHSKDFLDAVCTDIIHYDSLKLTYYPGNLSNFIRKNPAAAAFVTLDAGTLTFTFPTPGRLDGIKSRYKMILSMDKVNFTYPGCPQQAVTNANITICLASRVAILGDNGAGKSTMIKLMAGELAPDSGEVWKHHNLRIAYVAQHSFHHIEQHLESTPVEYIMWRFAGGMDQEILEKEALKMSAEESALMGQSFGQVEKLMGRRTRNKELEYHVKWVGLPEKKATYVTRTKLEQMGYTTLVKQYDEKLAAEAGGLDLRPLTTKEIQRHLDDFGLNQEFGTYGKILGLSGGQKVKLVLAAAMWNCPHLLFLDEPTNYLDREALGALTTALKGFGGGVITISHDKEFYTSIATEYWHVSGGRVKVVQADGAVASSNAVDDEIMVQKKKAVEKEVTDEEVKDKVGGNTNAIKSEEVLVDFWGKPLSKKEIRARKARGGS